MQPAPWMPSTLASKSVASIAAPALRFRTRRHPDLISTPWKSRPRSQPGGISNSPAKDVVFVPARADAATAIDRPRRRERSVPEPTSRSVRSSESDFPWLTWLIWGSVALVLILTAIAFLAPHGTWLVGCILMAIGGMLVPVAYFAGAYGAFSEDVLYGLLYIMFPLYTAYYLVTRWEDLWIWITCATVGVGLVLIGTEMVRWAGAAV